MAKQKKQPRVKARQPRGFPDRSPADIRATKRMLARIEEVYERYGFDPVETPMFEYTDALGKFLPDQDRPNAGVFSLQDDDDQWMSLRYDLTAPLARHVAQNINEIQLPYRTYRSGWVFRNEKPGPGRFRQFMQMDADSVGAPGPAADAEMCMMMCDTMEALGIARGDYRVRVSNRQLLEGIIDSVLKGHEAKLDQRLGIMRALDKFDRLGTFGVNDLLTTGRVDESGDRTEGLGLSEEQASTFITLLEFDRLFTEDQTGDLDFPTVGPYSFAPNTWIDLGFGDYVDEFKDINLAGTSRADPSSRPWVGAEISDLNFAALNLVAQKFEKTPKLVDALGQLEQMCDLFDAAGYDADRIQVDPTCVRGLEYYTGAVYECELTFPVTNERGETVTFGSVAGGGRYDGLVKRFTGQDVPATGFSIGVSRLQTALKNLGKLGDDETLAPVLVTVMDRDAEALAGYQRIVSALREAGIRAEMYQGNPKQFGKQLQYADRRGSPVAIIQGADERERGIVQVKDLAEGKRLSSEIADNQAWRAARPAQVECKEADVVAQVRSILQAQAEDGAEAGPA